MSGVNQAKVKSVLSGDTIILTQVGNPRNERTLSLAYVSAPRTRRDAGDEAFAVESRDYLRRLLVGKVIQFRTLYEVPSTGSGSGREYGQVFMSDASTLPDEAVSAGWLRVRDDAGKREQSELGSALIERLRVLEASARAEEKGLWDAEASKIQTSYEVSNVQDFAKQWTRKPLTAVVEKVLTGDRLIVRLLRSPTDHVQTMLLIAGIRAPNTKRINTQEGQELPAEPFGDDAHMYVETRLLQRRVEVTIVGVSPQNQLIGQVLHPNGDIAGFLLQDGLARCVDHHSTLLGQRMSVLRQSEKKARDQRKGLWKDAAAPRSSGPGADVTVTRVQTADTLYVRLPTGAEKRVNLSSVRQPKPSDPKQAPFGADAKEFMRKKLIGKHVKISTDGKRAATEGFDEREMVTVANNNRNVALDLVTEGYASVLRHKMDDTDRSPIYDDLLAAEATAQAEQKGMWSSKPPEAKSYVDYSENLEKAKRLLTLLSRQRRVPAIVDFVKSGSRFSLLIPRENAKLTLVLSGIVCPRSARNASESSEPFGKEAHELASRRCNQRDVEIDVEDTDKQGGFIGKLYVNRENFAKILLDDGFASVRTYSAEKSGNAQELLAAEQRAKDAKKGMWHDYDPALETNGDASAGLEEDITATNGDAPTSASGPSKDYRDVIVTHVGDDCRMKTQLVSPSTTGALSALMDAFRSFHLSPANTKTLSSQPKTGEVVAAQFSEDGLWYRARVRRNDRENQQSEVVYVDYGNTEMQKWSALRPLGKPEFGTSALKNQAVDAAMSFVQFPSGSQDYMADARNFLSDRLSEAGQLVARVDHTDARDGTLWVSLFDPNKGTEGQVESGSINAEVLEEGLGMVTRKPARFEIAQKNVMDGLRGVETEAMEARRGMWEYGDPTGLAED
ncbi:MAG: hypothetical protein Q9162_007767 [Coniocarpon cinnabarinum]